MTGAKVKQVAYGMVVLGIFIFVINTGVLRALPEFIWISLLFGLAASLWLGLPAWATWQRVASFIVLGIVAISTSDEFAGTAALGFPAMAFGLIYIRNPNRWWALIPGGILASIGLMLAFDALFPRWDATPTLFLGFAATFSFLYLRPMDQGGKRWALYPAILFIVLTVLINDPSGSMPGWFLPILLIGSGVFLLWWWRRKNK